MAAKDEVGRYGEDIAVRFLATTGLTILGRNWRCPQGEIDIVALDGDDVVIVEVKTRRSGAFGPPAEAVTREKLARLRRLAAAWLAQEERGFDGVRIDVVAVEVASVGAARVEHLRGVT
jgi:putative endonuclease